MLISDYLIDHRGLEWQSLLSEWTWLVPSMFTVWIMNRFGDLFIAVEDGTIHMLDIGGGTLNKVAESRDDFARKIDEGNNANQWLMIPLIDQLVSRGITLGTGKCYSYKVPPILGGQYTVENTFVLEIAKHFGAYGSIHSQLKDVPSGTKIVVKIKE